MYRIKLIFLLAGWLAFFNLQAQDQTFIDSVRTHIDFSRDLREKIDAYKTLIYYYQRYDLQKAQELIDEATTEIVDDKNDTTSAILMLMNANNHFQKSRYNEALNFALMSEKIFRENKCEPDRMKALNTIAAIYDRLGEWDSAMRYYQESLQLLNLQQNEHPDLLKYKPIILNNIACAYLRLDNIAEARQYFDKGIEIATAGNNLEALSNLYTNLGRYDQVYNDSRKTREHINRSIQLREQLEDPYGLAKSYFFLSSFFLKNDQPDSAQWAAQKSAEIAAKVGAIESEKNAYFHLHEAYKQEGKYEEALAAFERHKVLSDSILNASRMNDIMETRLRFEKDELRQIHLIEKQNLHLRFLLISGGLLVLVLLSLTLLYRQKYQKNKLERENEELAMELDSKNKELTTNVMYMVRKNEMITQIARRLLKLKENLKPENEKSVREIILDLQSEVDKEVWLEFETRFHQVHTSFYQNLLKAHPDLTPAEERLCAFLRLNMTTKEIAAITHQGIKSLEVARARLRKKFNINGTDTNLISYLEQF